MEKFSGIDGENNQLLIALIVRESTSFFMHERERM